MYILFTVIFIKIEVSLSKIGVYSQNCLIKSLNLLNTFINTEQKMY